MIFKFMQQEAWAVRGGAGGVLQATQHCQVREGVN